MNAIAKQIEAVSTAPRVFGAIAAATADLSKGGIAKDRANQQQGYKFRGIDDVFNALAPILARHALVIVPTVLSRDVVERQTQKGGTLFYCTVGVRWTLTSAEDGSSIEAVTYGEAMDSADKATNKAMSAAYKYMALLTFCIPTEGDNDTDAVTHEIAPQRSTACAEAIRLLNMKAKDGPLAFKSFWETNKAGMKTGLPPAEYAEVVGIMKALGADLKTAAPVETPLDPNDPFNDEIPF